MSDKIYKYLILGAGPAGLSFANRLLEKGENDFLVLEKESEAGGLCRSEEVDGSPLDIGGGHFLDVRRPKVNEFLFRFMPEEEWDKYDRDYSEDTLSKISAETGDDINVVKDKFIGIADEIVHVDGFSDTMSEIVKNFKINLSTKPDFVITDSNTIDNVKNFVVDVIYKIPSVETLVTPNADGKVYFEGLSTVTEIVESGVEEFYNFNYFLGLNISNTPWNIIVENFNAKNYLLVFGALMIPVLAYLTQVLSIKLMQAKNNTGDQMAQQMKMMNTFMPFMSLIMCFSVPVGLGIYWIVSAAYRIPQQILLNRHFDKMDLEAVIKKNEAKVKAKREKMGISEEQMRAIANRKTRTLQNKAAYNNEAEKEEQLNTANEMRANAKPGSLAAKANMVRDYNERNSRK